MEPIEKSPLTRDPGDEMRLVARIRAGDQQAMSELYDRYSKVVYAVALRVLQDAAGAEDVLQDVFLQLWRNPDAFDASRGSLAAWLAVIARHRSIDRLRKRRPETDIEDCVIASGPDLRDETERALLIEKVRGALDGMSPEQRQAMELAFFQGLTHTEIAEKTGEPLGTIKTRIRSGLQQLRAKFAVMKTHDQFAEDLALYALDELTGSERQELEGHLDTCAACRRELQALRGDLGLLGLSSSGPQPPARSKDRLMRAIAAEPRGVSSPSLRFSSAKSWDNLGSGLGSVGSIASSWLYCVRSNGRMKDQLAELAGHNQDQAIQLDRLNEEMRLLTAPDAVHVSLNPQKSPKQPSGTAIFSPSRKRMMFMASNLPPVPAGKAYELWIIPMQGAPMAAGVFKPDEHGNAMMMDHKMPAGVEAKAFAVTVENEEGSDKPTSPIMLMGEAG